MWTNDRIGFGRIYDDWSPVSEECEAPVPQGGRVGSPVALYPPAVSYP
jgi:hypothetical protein